MQAIKTSRHIEMRKENSAHQERTNKFKIAFGVLISFLTSPLLVSGENYDFIIVGGGTAGLAVARRLVEGGKHTVLVLECGGLPKPGMDIPSSAPRFLSDHDVTFRYPSTPQKNAGLINNGIITVFSGKMLSGTSNLNYMFFNRGNPLDYDNWGNLTQDSSWNYSSMLKYFKRSEAYSGDFPSDQHGFTGPITVSTPRYSPGLTQWLAAGQSLGYPVADPNGPQRRSVTKVSFAKKHGRRNSAFVGYIQPILSSTRNLRIVLNTTVTKILFIGKRAVGVQFVSTSPVLKGVTGNTLYANKEIIVSAGSYGSPVLLMRSGIGPKKVLSAARIPVVQELPVGENFQDHVYVPMHVIINNKSLVMDADRDLNAESWEFFKKFGDGPFSSTLGATGQAFDVSSVAKSEGETDEIIEPWEARMGVNVFVTRPKSRGIVSLNTSDPNGLPIVDLGFFSDTRDVEKLLYGIKEMMRFFEQTPSYRQLGARFPPVDIPACRQYPFRTDEYWRCYISQMSNSGCHPAGTCRMGRGPEAVVDTRLRVIGISGLRVVDAFIMPVVTNSNTHAAVYGIAEKGSDMILSDWQDAALAYTAHLSAYNG